MARPESSGAPPLYVWLGGDPQAVPSDLTIDDIPGVSDLQLLVDAIRDGRIGPILPTRIAVSPHANPGPGGFRSVDVGRLLRDHRIRHRRRYEVLAPDDQSTDDT